MDKTAQKITVITVTFLILGSLPLFLSKFEAIQEFITNMLWEPTLNPKPEPEPEPNPKLPKRNDPLPTIILIIFLSIVIFLTAR